MRTSRKLMSVSLVALLLMSLTLDLFSYAQAPTVPMTVWGYVHIEVDGVPQTVSAGINVYAKEAVTIIDQCSTTAVGKYYLSLEGPDEGTSMDLWVEDENVETITLSYMTVLELNLTMTGDVPDNVAPVADADGPYTGEEDEAISFDGSGSTDTDGTIASYVWTFGDGGTASVESPSHTYTTADTYVVTLTVTDNDGATHMDTTAATVTEPGAPPDDDDDEDEPDIPDPTTEFSIDYVDLVHEDYVDYADVLTIYGSGVTAGTTVKIFWDYASGTYAHLLNTTEGNPDGTFDCDIKVPSDYVEDHYLWATDESTGETVSFGPIEMRPKLKLSPSSGLAEDDVTIKGYGFTEEANFTSITFDGVEIPEDPSKIETDKKGYFTLTFEVEEDLAYGKYLVKAVDFYGEWDDVNFTLGASITLDPDEGPTGLVVEVEGRGWTPAATITFTMDGTTVQVVDDDVIKVKSGGTFFADIVIPNMGTEGDYEITATESGLKPPAHDDFEINGLPEIEVDPTYGTPGATITVTGANFTQIAGTEVTVKIGTDKLVTAETKSDGTFEDTFISPAITFKTYDVVATDEYLIDADDAFKVGLIAMIINPVSGEAGTKISITGIGFAPGDYNVTFGTKLYEEYGTVTTADAISDIFYVPNVEPGNYDLTVTDEDDNELTAQFMVTAISKVVFTPTVAPNDYNVSIKGYNFADVKDGEVEFIIYNVTADGELDKEWDMDVYTDPGAVSTVTDVDGNFTGYWEVIPDDELSIGDYTVNVTGSEGLLVQVPFSVVAARVSVAPRKAEFDRGDMIQFDINNDFKLRDSYIMIYDPYDILYWETEPFEDDLWILVEGLYKVPYYRQTAAGNQMELQSDAPMGAWLYIFYDVDDEQVMNGTFSVGPSTTALVDEKLTEIWGSIEDLTTNIDDITDEITDDIEALSGEIDDVVADVKDMIDDITADIADDLAAATDAAQDASDAVSDLEEAVSDIATSTAQLADDIADTKQTSTAAKEAAEDAQQTSQGLTGLVYGAIGASLIAALAAVISLMQISKKIA